MFLKYDLLTERLVLFYVATFVSEYKQEFQLTIAKKMAACRCYRDPLQA